MNRVLASLVLPAFAAAALVLAGAGCSSSTSSPGEAAPPPSAAQAPAPSGGVVAPSFESPPAAAPQEATAQDLVARQEALRKRQEEIAAHYIRVGQQYQQEGLLREARDAFANALEVQPGNAEAQRLYAATLALLGEPTGADRTQIQEATQARRALSQMAYTVAKEHLDRGRHFSTQGDHARAVEEFRNALLILQAHPNLDGDFNVNQLKDALADAERRRDEADREAEAARLRDLAEINREKEEAERQKVARRIARMWDQALDAFEQERFEQCETICTAIIDQDPTHGHAAQLREGARRARHEKANATTIAEYREQWQRFLEELKMAGLPFSRDVNFPDAKAWEKTAMKGPIEISRGRVQPREEDEAVRRTLESTRLVSVDWTGKTLDDAVKFIRNNTKVNIDIAKAVDEKVPPEERQLDDLKLDDISAMAALQLAIKKIPDLEYVIEDGMVKITTKEMARKRKVVEFFEVRDLTAKITNFPGVEINLNPSGVGAGVGGEEAADEGEENRVVEVDRLQELIRSTVDSTSWEEDPENTMMDKSGTLVVRQTPENQRKIRQLLSDLRKSAGIQVQIESRFISVENNFLQDIGVDFRGLGDNSGGVGQPGQGLSRPFDDFGLPGTPSVLGTDNSAGAFYSLSGGDGDIRGRTQNLFDSALGNPDVLTGTGGFSLQYTYLDDTQLEAILRAVQKYERVNTVTAPTLLVYNTQRANLQVTNHVAYVKDFDVEIAQAAVIADPIVDVVKEGVILDVRPIVSNDRRFVTLELRPSVATLVRPLRTFSTTLGVGTAVTFEVPELKKESLKTTVVMPDGGTLLLGGLKFYQEQDQDSGIPVLKDIPVLSFLFSRKGKYTNLRDLIVLLRVKIVIMEELEPGVALR